MRSMTGFGRGVVSRDGERATVELRSVNHRHLDIKLRGAFAPALEDQITAKLRAAIERGAVTVAIHVARRGSASGVQIDVAAARASHAALVQLAAALGLPGPDLGLVLAQPGVVVSDEVDDRAAAVAPLIVDAVDAAIEELQRSRAAEGQALERELLGRLDELSRSRLAIAAVADGLAQTLQRKFVDRVAKLARDIAIDPPPHSLAGSAAHPGTAGIIDAGRLAQEAAILADRADISEELVRLDSHVAQVRAAIASPGASGRRLEFLSQELGREFNTIGSKSQHREISAAVIDAKTALEKFREQVQNVE